VTERVSSFHAPYNASDICCFYRQPGTACGRKIWREKQLIARLNWRMAKMQTGEANRLAGAGTC
jgi:hypothetical protein